LTTKIQLALLERLAAIENIKQLKARYFRLIDQRRWAEWGEVFTTDAVMEVPDVDTLYRGRAEIVAKVSEVLAGATTCHHGHMPEITITSPGTATGTWAMFDYVEWPSHDDRRNGVTGYGHYSESYVVEDARWRIASLRLDRIRLDPLAD
jgi:hypothetical protein